MSMHRNCSFQAGPNAVETTEAPCHARAIQAALEREHGDPSFVLAEEERVKLELLLAELLQLKSRVHTARARSA